jgi:MSHA biogenesis protein MshJ
MMAKLKAWWVARKRREQWLAAIAALAFVAAAVELVALTPQRVAKKKLQSEIVAARAHLERLQATAVEIASTQSAAASGPPALQARRERAQALIERAQAELVAPNEMARQLAAILARHPQLRVVGMQSNAPKRVEGGAFYEHGLRVDVEGRYLDLLAYLDALRQAPHRIFWRSLEMKADGPVPVTRIELFTLSKEEVWLRL